MEKEFERNAKELSSKNDEIITYLLNLFVFSEFINLSELEILLMSSSMNVLMFNIIAVMIPVTELDLCEEKFYETK